MFGQLDWLSLQQDLHKCSIVYICQHNLAPPYLCDLFLTNSKIDCYDSFGFRAINYNTEYYTKCFTTSGDNIWNNLPSFFYIIVI